MRKEARNLQQELAEAGNYQQWLEASTAQDRLDGSEAWRQLEESADYDYRLINSRVDVLQRLRRRKDYDQMVFRLREELHGNLGNMANPVLYQKARAGTKELINHYLNEVTASLDLLCDANVKSLPPSRKRRFFNRAARSFGRSALLLSGGASYGLFHIGVIEELLEQKLMPDVITGSSAGSIVAGFVATHTDDELEKALLPDVLKYQWVSTIGILKLFKGEGILDPKQLRKAIERNIPDLTFLEAYEKTGRILNISVSPADPHQFSRLLNYLTSPNVLIRQAALASSAVPGLFPPVQLRAKNFTGKSVPYMPQSRWVDGSVHEDIPKEKVNRLHNVNHYIVSQTNPLVLPFMANGDDKTGILPFLQEAVVRGPIVQIEHLLELVNRHFEVPGMASALKKAHALVTQNYSGDINIMPDRQDIDVSKIIANHSEKEAKFLIEAGRRATWPKIERIRNTTQISRCFTACLKRLGDRYHYVKR
ncbi:MAG: DUF3336 domain-containing protein [Xanthomonadales bacterium]|nr:DUF3336 domain-containing protein [Xanthomonadales bacterium]